VREPPQLPTLGKHIGPTKEALEDCILKLLHSGHHPYELS
jgi:hypothetical protein